MIAYAEIKKAVLWRQNLTLNPSPKREGYLLLLILLSSPRGEGLGMR